MSTLGCSKEKVKRIIKNAIALDKVTVLNSYDNKECYLYDKSENEHWVYIPDNVRDCSGLLGIEKNQILGYRKFTGVIRVFGGKNVVSAGTMFLRTQADEIDLSNFETDKLVDMVFMFCGCKAMSIDFTNFNTSKVKKMSCAFMNSSIVNLDLSNFDLSSLESITKMFSNADIITLNINNFKSIENMAELFSDSKIRYINMRGIEYRKGPKFTRNLFKGSKLGTVEISDAQLSPILERYAENIVVV